MKKIALTTTQNANNYGAILQAFALQKFFSRYGHVKLVNYDNSHIGISLNLIRVKPTVHGLLGMGKDILRIVPRYKVIKKFKEFIQIKLFANADFVITDSFHGTCFSINFGLPFAVISSGVHSNRIESLLSLVGLQNRLIKNGKDYKKLDLAMDYTDTQESLLKARSESLSFSSTATAGLMVCRH